MVLIENPATPGGRLLTLRRCETLAKRGQLEFVVPGKRARMTGHRHQSAIKAEAARFLEMGYDACFHPAQWRVIQPASRNFKTLCAQLVMPR